MVKNIGKGKERGIVFLCGLRFVVLQKDLWVHLFSSSSPSPNLSHSLRSSAVFFQEKHCNYIMQIAYPATFYSHVYVDIPHDLMKHVIGTKGKWFKITCEKCNVANIWFNKQRSLVEIWGPINNLSTASFAIESRINVIKDRFAYRVKESDQPITWQKDDYEEHPLSELVLHEDFIGSEITMDHIRILIGKHGSTFKRITKLSGSSFVWFNSSNQSIQVWGLRESIDKAKAMILERLNDIFTRSSTTYRNATSSSAATESTLLHDDHEQTPNPNPPVAVTYSSEPVSLMEMGMDGVDI